MTKLTVATIEAQPADTASNFHNIAQIVYMKCYVKFKATNGFLYYEI